MSENIMERSDIPILESVSMNDYTSCGSLLYATRTGLYAIEKNLYKTQDGLSVTPNLLLQLRFSYI